MKDWLFPVVAVTVLLWTWMIGLADIICWFFTGEFRLIDWSLERVLFALFWPFLGFFIAGAACAFLDDVL